MKNTKWLVLGVGLLLAVLLAVMFRYQYSGTLERVDRWTGQPQFYDRGRWNNG